MIETLGDDCFQFRTVPNATLNRPTFLWGSKDDDQMGLLFLRLQCRFMVKPRLVGRRSAEDCFFFFFARNVRFRISSGGTIERRTIETRRMNENLELREPRRGRGERCVRDTGDETKVGNVQGRLGELQGNKYGKE